MSQFARSRTFWDHVFRMRRAGRFDAALQALEREWSKWGKNLGKSELALRASLYGELGRVARERQALEKAEELLRRALAEAPTFPDLHHQLGMVLLEKMDLPGARAAFEEALSIAPGYTAPALGLALVGAKEGNLGEAIHSLESLEARRRPDDEESFRQGIEQLRGGSWEDAEPLLLRAFHQVDRDVAEALQRVGRRLDDGRALEALEEARSIVERFPSHPDAHHSVGLACLALEWWDDAIEAFARALRWNSEFHEARVYLAWVLFARGESARAEGELARVLRADPGHSSARKLLDERGSSTAAKKAA